MGSDSAEKSSTSSSSMLFLRSPQSASKSTNSSSNGFASPTTKRHGQQVRSTLARIQICIACMFFLLLGTSINVMRLSHHVMPSDTSSSSGGSSSSSSNSNQQQEQQQQQIITDNVNNNNQLRQVQAAQAAQAQAPPPPPPPAPADKVSVHTVMQLTPDENPLLRVQPKEESERAKFRAAFLAQQANNHPPNKDPNTDSMGNPLTDIELKRMFPEKFSKHFTNNLRHEEEKLIGFALAHHNDHHRQHGDYWDTMDHPDDFRQDVERGEWFEAPYNNKVEQNTNSKDHIIPRREQHGGTRWEHATTLPPWMKDYFSWHEIRRGFLSETNWKQQKYLIMTCFADQTCGNVAHRLRPIPAMLRIAYDTKRLLLINWGDREKEQLEDYVEPPHHGGMNWTVPPYMMDTLKQVPQFQKVELIAQQADNAETLMVATMVQDEWYGEPYYNSKLEGTEEPADRVFHDVYNVLFKPTFTLQERIQETHHTMGLPPGGYATIHIDYKDKPLTAAAKQALKEKVENAMNCGSNLHPGGPYLVAAETFAIAKEAVKYAKKKNVVVAARQIAHDSKFLPKDFFVSWLEFYFMANTRCIAYSGETSYGQFGYMMGYDYNCRIQYEGYNARNKCNWTATALDAVQTGHDLQAEKKRNHDTMDKTAILGELGENDYKPETDDDAVHIHQGNAQPHAANADEEKGMPAWLKEYSQQNPPKPDELWSKSTTLPDWLKAYFSWHKDQKAKITEENWKEQRYLVLTCYGHNQANCGTVTHRLRLLPAQLRLAAQSQRILLLHWDKPFRLEFFVEPPTKETEGDKGKEEETIGVDWIVPEFMMWKVRKAKQQNALDILATEAMQDNRKVVNALFNFADDAHAEAFYNDRLADKEVKADRILRDVFHAFFQPTVLLQERVNEMLDHVELEPGDYSVAHVDYPIVPRTDDQKHHVRTHVEQAMNCLSQVAPGSNMLVFTETTEAAMYAVNYGVLRGVKIPAKRLSTNNHDKSASPDDLLGAFAEVYIIANAHCVAYNNGEFGELGFMLGEDYDCKIKYNHNENGEECMRWEGGSEAQKIAKTVTSKHV
ncbi:expressed unknown protein [Seminavis robusta]|uniref:Uncharacterized protein n=1 Tax=Seminavis robusta TaxID=568900 RepID=A0A9N8DD17_9STRA|nr:expressed unknown protein [Seminavis robusta]|eukprot:Sro86_g045770.1 n/a (1066) ;mRNA; f:73065-76357